MSQALVAVPGNASYRNGQQPMEEQPLHVDEEADRAASTARERREIQKENFQLCKQIVLFLVYLGVFTCAMFLESSASSSRFADHIRAMLSGGGPNHHARMSLERIQSYPDVYSFLEQTFLPALWENNTDTNQAVELSEYLHPVDISNRMMGSARIRQVRVKAENGCQMDPMFEQYGVVCYPDFVPGGWFPPSATNQDSGSFGPESKYRASEDPLGTGYAGTMGTYPSSGYMAFLSVNRTTALVAIDMLKKEDFLGEATRAVFIDFTLWNSNIGQYAAARVCIEFSPSGTTAKFLEITMLSQQMLSFGGHRSDKDWGAAFMVCLIMCFVSWFLCEEALEAYRNKYTYFLDPWNVLDWVNMILLIIAFFLRLKCFKDAGDAALGAGQLANKDSFASIRGLAETAETVKLLHAFNAVLLWGKCVKYLRHLPVVKVLVKTIWDAFALFLPLMTMFSIALIGFTMAYHIGFGDKIQELTTFPRAVVFLSRSFLRDVKLMPVYYITPIFGAFLILLFYVMLVLVGVQILFAIVSDAMYRAKHHPTAEDPDHRDEPLEEVLRSAKIAGIWIIRKCCPIIYRNFIKKPMSYEELQLLKERAKQGAEDKLAMMADGGESIYSTSTERAPKEREFTTGEIMLSIQHMSGRILSEVQEIGIEIRSELHDVCERVAQMQMAVEELSWRAELVRREQEQVM